MTRPRISAPRPRTLNAQTNLRNLSRAQLEAAVRYLLRKQETT